MDDPLDTSSYRGTSVNDFLRKIPVFGNIFGAYGVETAAEVNKKRAMEKMQQLMVQYRPEQLQIRQNSLDNAMKLFQPVNTALTKLYGSQAAMPIAAATQSPFPDEVMAGMKRDAAASRTRDPYRPAADSYRLGEAKRK